MFKKYSIKANIKAFIVSNFLIFFLALTIVFCGSRTAVADDLTMTPHCIGDNLETLGCWQKYPLPRKDGHILSLESVHSSILPDGTVLIVNGSSNRNTLTRIPIPGTNDFVKFSDGVKTNEYNVINNTALFNPETGDFTKIESPQPVQFDDTNDIFCGGHVHLFDGNILFAGGSNRYYPGEEFEGSKQINIYNWETSTWTDIGGQMQDGRWYPSLVPLADGKIVIFSGLGYDGASQTSRSIEIYDPDTDILHYFDLDEIPGSPYNTRITSYTYYDGEDFVREDADTFDGIDLYPRVFPMADGRLLLTGDGTGKSPLDVHKSNKTYFMSVTETGETLSISFQPGPDRPDISKVFGTAVPDPNRPGDVLLIGGILNTNNINFGKPQLGVIDDYGNAPPGTTNAALIDGGARIATSLEHWDSTSKSWEFVPNFLQKDNGDLQPRSMNEAVILPNKDILTVNGGLYAEYAQVYEPLLMTYNPFADGGYDTTEMNPATLPRLYHNGALLLPDARVLTIGGNANRAAREDNGIVHVDVVPDPDEYYTLAKITTDPGTPGSGEIIPEDEYEDFLEGYYNDPQGYFVQLNDTTESIDPVPFAPAEIWQVEIFNPPYLFLEGDRPIIATAPTELDYEESSTITVTDVDSSIVDNNGSLVMVKLGTITHSLDYGQVLADLTIQAVTDNLDGSYNIGFTAPENQNLYTPGYYMMFYVNNMGKPSVSKMVRLNRAS